MRLRRLGRRSSCRGGGVSRVTSLLPPVHVALVKPSQTLEGLDDLYLLRRLAYLRDGVDAGSYMNFITGPSRTAGHRADVGHRGRMGRGRRTW